MYKNYVILKKNIRILIQKYFCIFFFFQSPQQQECAASSCVGCLSCQGNTVLPISSLTSNDFDCGSCFDSTSSAITGVGIVGSTQNHLQQQQQQVYKTTHLTTAVTERGI